MRLDNIFDAVLDYDADEVAGQVQAAIDASEDIHLILKSGLMEALDDIGENFSSGEIFMPEMLAAAQAVKAGLNVLRPHLSGGKKKSNGTVVLGTVRGDLHDIGKNLVGMVLEGAGFEVIDLGTNVDAATFLDSATSNAAKVVGLSCLITTTLPAMASIVSHIKEKSDDIMVIVGGAPLNQAFCDSVSADGYSEDAVSCVRLVRRLLNIADAGNTVLRQDQQR